MPSWSGKWFFFLVIGFLIYTIAGGYGSKWKQIFTATANPTPAPSGSGGVMNPSTLTPGTNLQAVPGVNALPGITF